MITYIEKAKSKQVRRCGGERDRRIGVVSVRMPVQQNKIQKRRGAIYFET